MIERAPAGTHDGLAEHAVTRARHGHQAPRPAGAHRDDTGEKPCSQAPERPAERSRESLQHAFRCTPSGGRWSTARCDRGWIVPIGVGTFWQRRSGRIGAAPALAVFLPR